MRARFITNYLNLSFLVNQDFFFFNHPLTKWNLNYTKPTRKKGENNNKKLVLYDRKDQNKSAKHQEDKRWPFQSQRHEHLSSILFGIK
jgi:hypothetical protein